MSSSKNTATSSQIYQHLDRHLVLPLLDHLEARGTYSHDEVLQAKYDLLTPTNMIRFVYGFKRELDGVSEDAEMPEGESIWFYFDS